MSVSFVGVAALSQESIEGLVKLENLSGTAQIQYVGLSILFSCLISR
jgi:hypothetical protein